MIEALNELDLVCRATPSGGGPEIPYYQVEIGPRKPLPFTRARDRRAAAAHRRRAQVAGLVSEPTTVDAAFGSAARFLTRTATPTSLAALRGERQAPPLLGHAGRGTRDANARPWCPAVGRAAGGQGLRPLRRCAGRRRPACPPRPSICASAPKRARPSRTRRSAWRVAPPTLAAVTAERSRSIAARLVIVDAPAVNDAGGAAP